MTGINLKPCPCCGSTAAFNNDGEGANWIECTKETCGLSTAKAWSLMDSCLPELAESWNRRAGTLELEGVAEQLAEGAGLWASCTGCYETEDGHPVGQYPYSQTLGCALGAGCSECGGIGAVWDNTDYDAMAADLQEERHRTTQQQEACLEPHYAAVRAALTGSPVGHSANGGEVQA